MKQFDIVIVGGGLIGCCLTYALRDLPLKIGIIEAKAPDSVQSTDNRAIALTYGSQQYLEQLGLWSEIAKDAVPINQVHVSDKGHFGITRINAVEMAIAALGYVVPFNILQQAFQHAVQNIKSIQYLAPARVLEINKADKAWQLTLDTTLDIKTVSASLVIAADGGNSTIRKLQHIPVEECDYQQSAIITHVALKRSHNYIAYERFTDKGAIALLPYQSEQQAAMVWTLNNEDCQKLLQLDDDHFIKCLQAEFGYRAGRFLTVSPRLTYPLKMIAAQPAEDAEIILLGNAAHTVHPIAAQGFNLGLRDVAVLAQQIVNHYDDNKQLKPQIVNQQFLQQREKDYRRTMHFTDSLIRIFTNDFTPLSLARNIGLTGLNLIPGLKRPFTKLALGIIR